MSRLLSVARWFSKAKRGAELMPACGGRQDTDAADAHHFVSSVCWSRSGHVLVAANSLGTVKLLQLA